MEVETKKVTTLKPKSKYKEKLKKKGKPTEVPKDLEDSFKALVQLQNCHTLIQEGMFPFKARNTITEALSFLEQLHKLQLDVCLAHPEAHMIQSLKDIKAANGKS